MSNALNLRLVESRHRRRWREQAELDEDQEWAQFVGEIHQAAMDSLGIEVGVDQNAKRRLS